jgi:alkyl sulfatase BDS1-like metallo-beta-lactamase superfamily hydrolase
MGRVFAFGLVALLFTAVGFVLGRTELGAPVRELADRAQEAAVDQVVRRGSLDTRTRVLLENPKVMTALAEGGAFGGEFSAEVAQNMFGRTEKAIAAAREKMNVVAVAPRTWLIRLPIVNAVLFETDEGLVLVDAGMAPAGPAIVDAIRSVSDAPLHTVIYTHGHVDHAYGTWALLEAGWQPEVVAHEKLIARFERYIRLRGSVAQYMSQKEEQMPASREDLVWPTRTFDGNRLDLEIGGETFELHHAPGETDDQLWVWAPGRQAIASADYYQGFLPNAGNGKRVQRYLEEWSDALTAMADLQPAILLPAHGEALDDPALIQENLRAHAEVLRYVIDHTLAGLNAGQRKDQIFGSLELPPHLAEHPSLNIQYVTPQDLSKMVIRRYTGWWDDVPSHWTPASQQAQGRLIVELAGGMAGADRRARALADEGALARATHQADGGVYAGPGAPKAPALGLDV